KLMGESLRHAASSRARPRRNPLSFLALQHQPSPPLFPYTTLFRSIHTKSFDVMMSDAAHGTISAHRTSRWPGKRRSKSCASASEDRKSTRLNFSHVSISYAVFCLKKKNKNFPSALATERRTRSSSS